MPAARRDSGGAPIAQSRDAHEAPHGAGKLPAVTRATRAQGLRETIRATNGKGDLSISCSLERVLGSELQLGLRDHITLVGGIASAPKYPSLRRVPKALGAVRYCSSGVSD